jgi:hypothetical protein
VREADRLACSVSSPFPVLEDEEDEDEEPEGGFVVAFASCLRSFCENKSSERVRGGSRLCVRTLIQSSTDCLVIQAPASTEQ